MKLSTNFGLTLALLNLSKNFHFKRKFTFKLVTEEFVKNIISDLSQNKAAGVDIPLKVLKDSTFVLPYLVRCVNETLVKSELLDSLIVPVRY